MLGNRIQNFTVSNTVLSKGHTHLTLVLKNTSMLVWHWEFTINTIGYVRSDVQYLPINAACPSWLSILYNEKKNCPLCWCSEKLVCHKIRMWQDERRWLWQTLIAPKLCFSCIPFLMYDTIESYSGLCGYWALAQEESFSCGNVALTGRDQRLWIMKRQCCGSRFSVKFLLF